MKTTAAIMAGIGKPLRLAAVDILPLSYGQVRVKVIASGICGAQLQELDGYKAQDVPTPRLMGHEGCGEVLEIGPHVSTVKVGDRVVMHWRKGDGIESEFPRFRVYEQDITSGRVTTFSEETVVSENRITTVPQETPVELCAMLGCGLSTALGTIEQEVNLLMGQRVLIVGCGGLGLNLILAAKMRKAGYIVALDIHESKKDAAYQMGANDFIWNDSQFIGHDFDVVIDTTGDCEAIARTLSLLASSGKFIMVGQPKPGAALILHSANHMFDGEGKTIKATQGGCFNPAVDIPRYIQLHQSGMLDITGIITHRIPLRQINDGIALVRSGQAGRVLIEP